MADLAEISLEYAIKTGNNKSILEFLKERATPLPAALCHLLAAHLDHQNRKGYKTGPKEKSNPRESGIITYYRMLCTNPEMAKLLHYHETKEAFRLADASEIHDTAGNFAPVWKFPHLEEKRKRAETPSDGEIKDIVCKLFGIGERTFAEFLSKSNKQIRSNYDSLLRKGFPEVDAIRMVCEYHLIRPDTFNRINGKRPAAK